MSDPVFLLAADSMPSAGQILELDGPEGRHAARVKRLRSGESLILTNGRGMAVRGEVREALSDSLLVTVLKSWQETAPVPVLTVVQALPKGERADQAVETLTEVGVDRIVPWQAHHSVSVWRGDKATKGVDKWRRVADESAKQSRRLWWPEVERLHSTSDVVSIVAAVSGRGGLSLVLHEDGDQALNALLEGRGAADVPPEVLMVVGPEGGISANEREQLGASGAHVVRLGPTVLRTAHAGMAACAVVMSSLGRWD